MSDPEIEEVGDGGEEAGLVQKLVEGCEDFVVQRL